MGTSSLGLICPWPEIHQSVITCHVAPLEHLGKVFGRDVVRPAAVEHERDWKSVKEQSLPGEASWKYQC